MEKKAAWSNKPGVWLAGAAIGAAAMYFSDPDRGSRRRALVLDKMHHLKVKTAASIGITARDLANRMKGMRARFHRIARSRETNSLSDPGTTVARLRAKMGRYVSNPHSIEITWQNGHHVLSGPVLAHEKDRLLAALRMTPGIGDIEDKLQAHERAEGIPGLQGVHKRRPPAPEILQENWTPALRGIAIVAGSLLAAYGLMRRTPGNLALGAAGAALLTRGTINAPLARMFGAGTEENAPSLRQPSEFRDDAQERDKSPWEAAPVVQPSGQASWMVH